MKLFKKTLAIIIGVLFIFCINVNSKTLYNKGYKTVNNYIKDFHNYQKFIIIDSQKYGFKNKQLYDDSNLKYGGLINKEEFDISKESNSTYLFNGLEYFTMTKDGSNKIFIVTPTNTSFIASKTLSTEKNNLRVTNYIQSDVKLTGHGTATEPWKFIDKFSVQFNYNDDQATLTPNTIIVPENGVARSNVMAKNNYVYSSNDCDAEYNELTNKSGELILREINKDIKCNVKMEYDIKNITLLSNGGTIEQKSGWTVYNDRAEKIVYYGNKLGELPNVDWGIGYHLSGYSANGQIINKDTIITENLVIEPLKEANIFTLTYNSTGGTNCASTSQAYGTKWGGDSNSLCTPTRIGYTFNGWYTESNGGNNITKDTIVAGNLTVYAHWIANSYKLTADANGGTIPATTGWTVASGNATATKSVTYASTYGTLPTPTKKGYTFQGWNGKNMFDIEKVFGSIGSYNSGYYVLTSTQANQAYKADKNGIPYISGFKENTRYTLTITGHSSEENGRFRICFHYTDGTNSYSISVNSTTDTTVTYTSTEGKTIDFIFVTYGSGRTLYFSQIMLEEGAIATEYEPYYITSSTNVTQAKKHTINAIWQANNLNFTGKSVEVNYKTENQTITNFINEATNGTGSTTYSIETGSDSFSLNNRNLNIEAGTNIGVYNLNIKATDNISHVSATAEYVVTIVKFESGCPLIIEGYEGTYDGQAHTITIGTPTGGTLQYRTSTTGTWSNDKPKKTNAGTTTVYIRVLGDENHTNKDCGSANIVINKRTVTVTAPTVNSATLTYNAAAQNLLATAGSCSTGGTMYWYGSNPTTSNSAPSWNNATGWTTTAPTSTSYKGTNAGTYYIWYYCKVADTTNNTGTGINTVSSVNKVINKYNLSNATIGSISAQNYTGSAITPTPAVTVPIPSGSTTILTSGTHFKYSYSSNINSTTDARVIITAKDNTNYTGSKYKTFTINKVDAACPNTITEYEGTYNGQPHTITIGSAAGGTLQYRTSTTGTWSNDKPERINAGTTTVYIQVLGDDNHNTVSCGNKKITINRRTVIVTAPTVNSATLTYNATAQNLLSTVGSCSEGGTMYWLTTNPSTSSSTPTFSTSTWTTTVPTSTSYKGTNAGTYYIWYYCKADTTNNTGTGINEVRSVNKKINKRTVTVTPPTVIGVELTDIGEPQRLLEKVGSCSEGGTMYWYEGNPSTSNSAQSWNNGTGWTTAPTSANYEGTNAGTYYIWYYCKADTTNNTGTGINTVSSVNKTINPVKRRLFVLYNGNGGTWNNDTYTNNTGLGDIRLEQIKHLKLSNINKKYKYYCEKQTISTPSLNDSCWKEINNNSLEIDYNNSYYLYLKSSDNSIVQGFGDEINETDEIDETDETSRTIVEEIALTSPKMRLITDSSYKSYCIKNVEKVDDIASNDSCWQPILDDNILKMSSDQSNILWFKKSNDDIVKGRVGGRYTYIANPTSQLNDGYIRYLRQNQFHQVNDIVYEEYDSNDTNILIKQYNGAWYNFKKNIDEKPVDAVDDEEYYIKNETNGNLTTIKQSTSNHTANELATAAGCDLSENDCTVTLYVNWFPHTLRVQYNGNGGTWNNPSSNFTADADGYVRDSAGSRDIHVEANAKNKTIKLYWPQGNSDYINFINDDKNNNKIPTNKEWFVVNKNTGYKTEFPKASPIELTVLAEAAGCNLSEMDCTVTLYVNWQPHSLNIQYNGNGGTWINPSNSSYTVDNEGFVLDSSGSRDIQVKVNNLEGNATVNLLMSNGGYINFIKNGSYINKNAEWGIKNSTGTIIKEFKQATPIKLTTLASAVGCNLSETDCTITLYVNWKPPTLTIRLNGNGGIWNASKAASDYSVDSEGFVLTSGSINYYYIENPSANETRQLPRPQNGSRIWFDNKVDHHLKAGSEWIIKNNAQEFPQATNISLTDLASAAGCDLSKESCVITAYVNWETDDGTSGGFEDDQDKTLRCELKINNKTDGADVRWAEEGHKNAIDYGITTRSNETNLYNKMEFVNIRNIWFYGNTKNDFETKTCILKVRSVCGTTAFIRYHGQCTCSSKADAGQTIGPITISNTSYSNCTAYCSNKYSRYPYGNGALYTYTTKSCFDETTIYQCANGGCSINNRCYVTVTGGNSCPGNYGFIRYEIY